MKLLTFASTTSFLAMIAFGMFTWEQSIIDEMTALPDDVVAEMSYLQCKDDYRGVHNVRFKYDMRETCKRIMNGEAVL